MRQLFTRKNIQNSIKNRTLCNLISLLSNKMKYNKSVNTTFRNNGGILLLKSSPIDLHHGR